VTIFLNANVQFLNILKTGSTDAPVHEYIFARSFSKLKADVRLVQFFQLLPMSKFK
jgi:hypothetical protein